MRGKGRCTAALKAEEAEPRQPFCLRKPHTPRIMNTDKCTAFHTKVKRSTQTSHRLGGEATNTTLGST
jgi:hypothetical protein